MMGRRGEATAPPRTRRERPLRPRILPALGQARCACQRMRTTTHPAQRRARGEKRPLEPHAARWMGAAANGSLS